MFSDKIQSWRFGIDNVEGSRQALHVLRLFDGKTFLAIRPSGIRSVSRDLGSRERAWRHDSTESSAIGEHMFNALRCGRKLVSALLWLT